MPIKIVHELRIAKGRNAKLAILKKHSNNTLWKNVLVAMYDSSINYYVSAPSDATFTEGDCNDMFDILHALSSRLVTGNKARALATQGSKAYGEIFRLVLKGSLGAGVSVKSINAAYPCLIPTFDVMLAEKNKPDEFPVLASIKYDGVRVVAFVDRGSVMLKTRNGKNLDIESLNNSMAKQTDGAYDCELVMGDGLQESRTSITGEVNRVLKGTSTDIVGCTLCIFDKLTLQEWESKECSRSLRSRLCALNEEIISDILIRSIRQKELNSHEEIESLFQDMYAMGYEGLILRYADGLYEWKRTKSLMKVKSTDSLFLECTDVIEGTGKYVGMVGSLVCTGMVNDMVIKVKVGTGLSDIDRDKPFEYYIGSTIDVEYNDIVKAIGASHFSLFLPVFKRVAGDYDV